MKFPIKRVWENVHIHRSSRSRRITFTFIRKVTNSFVGVEKRGQGKKYKFCYQTTNLNVVDITLVLGCMGSNDLNRLFIYITGWFQSQNLFYTYLNIIYRVYKILYMIFLILTYLLCVFIYNIYIWFLEFNLSWICGSRCLKVSGLKTTTK